MKNDESSRIEKLEQLIQSKAFHELSVEERNFIFEEFESEEHYTALQKLSPALNKLHSQHPEIQPRSATLEFLKQALSTETRTSSFWSALFGLKIPAYAGILTTLFCCLITWWFASKPATEIVASPVLAQIDTVYVATRPDTVFREKIVYRLVKITEEQDLPSELKHTPTTQKEIVPVGVSMKDKEELEKLLVSGTR